MSVLALLVLSVGAVICRHDPTALPVLVTTVVLQMVAVGLLSWFNWQELQSGRDPAIRELDRERKEFDDNRRVIVEQLEQETARLEQNSRRMAEKFRIVHEWLDSPELVNLTEYQLENHPQSSPKERQQLIEKDQKVAKILEQEAEEIYEKIRRNHYLNDGRFDARVMRNDLLDLGVEIAKIYLPEEDNPLLHTSPEQIARALNRIGLHLLVVLDQLPLNLKASNIQQTYDTISKAVKAYGSYRKAAPYLGWASRGLMIGRMVTSVNPVTLGLWWGATELGKMGATHLATRMIDRQAIGLIHSLVRVVGYEVASVYSGDFRYRDANWCYAVELTQLQAALPKSREMLQRCLREVSQLELRNEYDRLAVYRAVSVGKAISRSTVDIELLSENERRGVLERLEILQQEVAHGQSTEAAREWRKGIQAHLGMQLSLGKNKVAPRQELEQDREILNTLLGYLVGVREVAWGQACEWVRDLLHQSGQRNLFSAAAREAWREKLPVDQAQFVPQFTPPDLDPGDARVRDLLEVLLEWNAIVGSFAPEAEQLLLEFGLYYRVAQDKLESMLNESYRQLLLRQFPEQKSRIERYSISECRSITLLLDENAISSLPQQVFGLIKIPEIPDELKSLPAESLRIALVDDVAVLFQMPTIWEIPEILWRSDSTTRWKNRSGVMTASLELTGGKSTGDLKTSLKSILIEAPMTARFQTYFASLLQKIPAAATE